MGFYTGGRLKRQPGGVTPPRRTFAEMSEALGFSPDCMRGHFARSLNWGLPTPASFKPARRGGQSYYDPKAFRAWWAAYETLRTKSAAGPVLRSLRQGGTA